MLRARARSLALVCLALVHVGSGFVGVPAEDEPFRRLPGRGNSPPSESREVDETAISTPEQIPVAARLRMRESVQADQYAIRPPVVAGAAIYETRNPEHGLRAAFLEDDVQVRPAGDDGSTWVWSLQLERFGYEGSLDTVEKVPPVAEGNRVEYRRAALTEWYVNDPRGLEQGFTVSEAPSSAPGPPLVLELRASGLTTRQNVAGESILLAAADGSGVLRYGGLIAWDADGTHVPAEMWATPGGIRIEVDDRGAVYPLTVDPFIESAVLRASDAQ